MCDISCLYGSLPSVESFSNLVQTAWGQLAIPSWMSFEISSTNCWTVQCETSMTLWWLVIHLCLHNWCHGGQANYLFVLICFWRSNYAHSTELEQYYSSYYHLWKLPKLISFYIRNNKYGHQELLSYLHVHIHAHIWIIQITVCTDFSLVAPSGFTTISYGGLGSSPRTRSPRTDGYTSSLKEAVKTPSTPSFWG